MVTGAAAALAGLLIDKFLETVRERHLRTVREAVDSSLKSGRSAGRERNPDPCGSFLLREN